MNSNSDFWNIRAGDRAALKTGANQNEVIVL